ncbi:MAG: RNase adapter RapZ [Neomegalonema sp.]|nr:RNase adapter RapZ [Neomegalonema sp.]
MTQTRSTSAAPTRVILVTGRSGAGRSTALAAFEDFGFETVDRPPVTFIPEIATELACAGNRAIAIGMDASTVGFSIGGIEGAIARLKGLSGSGGRPAMQVEILFLDGDDEALRRRYTETRRRHPMAPEDSIETGLERDRREVLPLRDLASAVINTSALSPHDLKRELRQRFAEADAPGMAITCMSFSYKKGVPDQADMVLDCRFLRNPHYEPNLRPFTGREPAVAEFVAADPLFAPFFDRVLDLAQFLLPAFIAEGKSYLTIAFGCTGGKHRSVAMAEAVARQLNTLGWSVRVRHREQQDAAQNETGISPDPTDPAKGRTNAA